MPTPNLAKISFPWYSCTFMGKHFFTAKIGNQLRFAT